MRLITETVDRLVAQQRPLLSWGMGFLGIAVGGYLLIALHPWTPVTLVALGFPILFTGVGFSQPSLTLTLDWPSNEIRLVRRYLFLQRTWKGKLTDVTATKYDRVSHRQHPVMYTLFLVFRNGQTVSVTNEDVQANLEPVNVAIQKYLRRPGNFFQ